MLRLVVLLVVNMISLQFMFIAMLIGKVERTKIFTSNTAYPSSVNLTMNATGLEILLYEFSWMFKHCKDSTS